MERWGHVALEYYSKRIFVGLYPIIRATTYPQGNTTSTISNEGNIFQLFVGYRFNVLLILDKKVDQALKKFNLVVKSSTKQIKLNY